MILLVGVYGSCRDEGDAGGRAGRQGQTARWLHGPVVVAQADCQAATCQAVRAERDQLASEVERLQADNQRLKVRVGELAAQVEQLRRAAKRQAAPFATDRPSPHPGRPGRKPGQAYGRHGRRPIPERVDRVVAVGLPAGCPSCGGRLAVERVASQWQEDLPPPAQTEICRYEVQIGRCLERRSS